MKRCIHLFCQDRLGTNTTKVNENTCRILTGKITARSSRRSVPRRTMPTKTVPTPLILIAREKQTTGGPSACRIFGFARSWHTESSKDGPFHQRICEPKRSVVSSVVCTLGPSLSWQMAVFYRRGMTAERWSFAPADRTLMRAVARQHSRTRPSQTRNPLVVTVRRAVAPSL